MIDILKGWLYLATDQERELAEDRAQHCRPCEHRTKMSVKIEEIFGNEIEEITDFKCGLCGCPLNAMLRVRGKKCEAGKWEIPLKQ
jgi:hypothetical protein